MQHVFLDSFWFGESEFLGNVGSQYEASFDELKILSQTRFEDVQRSTTSQNLAKITSFMGERHETHGKLNFYWKSQLNS